MPPLSSYLRGPLGRDFRHILRHCGIPPRSDENWNPNQAPALLQRQDVWQDQEQALCHHLLSAGGHSQAVGSCTGSTKETKKFDSLDISGSRRKHVGDANEAVRCERVASDENAKQGRCSSYQCKRGRNISVGIPHLKHKNNNYSPPSGNPERERRLLWGSAPSGA